MIYHAHRRSHQTRAEWPRETGAGRDHAPRVTLLSRETRRRPVVYRVEPFPWRLVAYLVTAEVVVAWMAWRFGLVDAWTERVIVWGMW